MATTIVSPAADAPPYQAAWRRHFYAGLPALPLLLWLSVTGAPYLYKPEIERLVIRSGARPARRAQTRCRSVA